MRKQSKLIIFALKISILSICIFISPRVSEALETPPSVTPVNKEIIHGIELLYNSEFDKAEKLFLKLIEGKREDPAGYFYFAMVNWSRLASGFWSPGIVREYGERIDGAISVAKKEIENGEADSFTYFYLGGALGFKGRFQLMRRQWLNSFFLAYDAIEALKTCLKMDPNNKDVLLGLGIFDYYTARLSGVLKFLSYLLLHKGDKAEGLRKLHIAAEEAVYSSIEAKSLLLHIYLFLEEDYYRKALDLAEELSERFKDNPRNKFLQGVAYIRLGRDDMYREVADFLYKRGQSEVSRQRASEWNDRFLYLEASYYLFHDQYEKARSKLDGILSQTNPAADPAMVAWPLLKKVMSYDIEGKREKALKYYKEITEMENGAGAQFLAERYMDKPARKGDPFLGY